MRGVPARTKLVKENLIYRGVPKEYTEATLNEYTNEKKRKFFNRYLANLDDMYEDKVNLCLYGNNGTGKTFLSSILIKESYRLRYDSYMITLAQLLDLTFRPNKSEEDIVRMNYIKHSHFLVIDEVGKENFTSTGSNINLLEDVLRRAVTNGQVVVICTNLPLEELYKNYGKSIQSLIQGDYAKVEFNFDDYRPVVQTKKKALRLLRGE